MTPIEIKEKISDVLHHTVNLLPDNEYVKHSIYDELNNYLVNALNMLDKLDTLEDTKRTREIVYLRTEYRYTEVEQRMFLLSHIAHSLHELSEMHIYEVTVKRTIADANTDPTVDYIHTVTVIADFDYNNCTSEAFKRDFKDEIFDSIFDVRFDTLDATIKQLS